jgi:mannose-6-phosphate isomerase-like protein (cupin superfamily)
MTAKQLRSRLIVGCLAAAAFAQAAERPVDPTFLFRKVADAAARPSDLSSDTCRYRPLFGAGDQETSIVKGVSRYGVMEIDPRGRSAAVRHPGEERIYFVLEGSGEIQYGGKSYPIKPSDFMYLAPGVEYSTENTSTAALRIVVIGYHVPEGSGAANAGAALQIRNASEAEKQVLSGHPPSTKYLLLMGGKDSKRDLIAAGEVLTSLFIMEFDAGGTNHPHHHMTEEEVYLLLEGDGEMVAGGGMNGIEGRHRATPGDAYFYRPNCTVGFYASPALGGKKARILAARSTYPGMKK